MKRFAWAAAFAGLATLGCTASAEDKPGYTDTPMLPDGKWRVHDPDRPYPEVVTPGAGPGAAPSDAVVLFDGTSLDAWQPQATPWPVANGAMTATPPASGEGGNGLTSKESFGDVQLHLEFRSPNPPSGTSQDRGNSGVYFMERYEIQILDGHDNATYADGTVGAIYAWKPPLVNASRPPGDGRATTSCSSGPASRPMASCCGRRMSLSSSMGCWCRTARRSSARPPGGRWPSTNRTATPRRSTSRITILPSRSATSGFVACPKRRRATISKVK